MDRTALHQEIRNALSLADELSRHEHYLGQWELAGVLAAVRSSFEGLERDVGRSHAEPSAPGPEIGDRVQHAIGALLLRVEEVPPSLRRRMRKLVASAERVSLALWNPDARVPSKPLLGVLPLARVVPQDVHSVLDYVSAAGFFASARLGRTARARDVGAALGAGVLALSLATDYRLSAAKLVPIEVHEIGDHVSGLAAIAAPFALGYAKKDPLAAMIHVGIGVGIIVASLFTDYRASKGVTLPVRSKGGPRTPRLRRRRRKEGAAGAGAGAGEQQRVSQVQRPLEGLSAAPTDWDPDGMRFVVGGGTRRD